MVKEDLLQLVFHSDEPEDNLKKITVLNVPGQLNKQGSYEVDDQIISFFKNFVADELFALNRKLSLYSFESLKLWLCQESQSAEAQAKLQGERLPTIDSKAVTLISHLTTSELKKIVVLDASLKGNQQMLWENACHELLTPLFGRFVPPAKPPEVLRDFLLMRVGTQLSNKLDLSHGSLKNS
ncbi:MAG: hypothetical protein AAGN15_21340 [Cyanobacteria bacterium J06581_3]